jgi:guanylate kinase
MDEQKPALTRLDEFQSILATYKISPHAQKILEQTKLVVMSGLSGSGRNAVIDRWVELHGYFFIVSDTTRPAKMRNGQLEKNGVHYFFRTEEDFLNDLKNGEFLEAEIIHDQQVSGVSIRELENASSSGKIAIHDFEYGGANNVAKAKPNVHVIVLLPPSYQEWHNRLTRRETMSEGELKNRMKTAQKVIENAFTNPNFKIVVNDDLEACVETIHRIVERNEYDEANEQNGKRVATEILEQIKTELAVSTLEF